MESVDIGALPEKPRITRSREPFWKVTRVRPSRPRYNRTEISMRALLHIYDAYMVQNAPSAVWRSDGLYRKLPSTNMQTFKEALAWLHDKGVIRLNLDDRGHVYAAITERGIRLMKEPGGGRTLAALFS